MKYLPPAPTPPKKADPSQQVQRTLDGVPLPPATGEHTYKEPFKEHDWAGRFNPNAPGWLNGGGGGDLTCAVCGVTLVKSFVRADRTGMDYCYRDAYGNVIESMEPLPCPVFIGNTNGAVMEGRVNIRVLTGRTDRVEGRVDTVETRLDALEVENRELREKLDQKIQLDVTGLIDWLSEMVALHAAKKLPTVLAQVKNEPLALPAPVADLVLEVGRRSRKKERVPVKRGKKP